MEKSGVFEPCVLSYLLLGLYVPHVSWTLLASRWISNFDDSNDYPESLFKNKLQVKSINVLNISIKMNVK